MEVIASTKIRRQFKHEVYMKTKKSMELAAWDQSVTNDVVVRTVSEDKKVPGRCVSPWVLESVLSVARERFPDSNIYVVRPQWPDVCKKYAKIVKKMPKGDIINLGVLKWGVEEVLKGSPKFIVIDSTVCWAGGAKPCDAIISGSSKKAINSVIRKFYGRKQRAEYKLIGELPKIKLAKDKFGEKLFAKKHAAAIYKHPLYSLEFS